MVYNFVNKPLIPGCLWMHLTKLIIYYNFAGVLFLCIYKQIIKDLLEIERTGYHDQEEGESMHLV